MAGNLSVTLSVLEKIETSTAKHEIKGDILYIIFKKDADVDLDDMLESKKARIELQNGSPMKVFVDLRGLFQISREARKYAAEAENAKLSTAMAILTDSLPTKLIANFFIKFNKPPVPTRMFKDKRKAITWLSSIH